MKKILLGLLLVSVFCIGKGQSDSLNTPEKLVDHFFFLMQDNSDNAVDFLFSTNPFFDIERMPQLEEIKGQLNKLFYFGNLHGYELSSVKTMSPSLKMFTYIARYTRQPIRVDFYFYKPNKRWQIQTFMFDEDFRADFEKIDAEFLNQKTINFED